MPMITPLIFINGGMDGGNPRATALGFGVMNNSWFSWRVKNFLYLNLPSAIDLRSSPDKSAW
jgi:hypothetical protein